MAADKIFAIKHLYRIPEKTLLIVTFAGGSLGAWLAMVLLRHKTLHKKFRYGIPAALFLHLLLVLILSLKLF